MLLDGDSSAGHDSVEGRWARAHGGGGSGEREVRESGLSFLVIFGGTKFRESSEENNAINKTNNKWLCARVLGVQGFSMFFFWSKGVQGF